MKQKFNYFCAALIALAALVSITAGMGTGISAAERTSANYQLQDDVISSGGITFESSTNYQVDPTAGEPVEPGTPESSSYKIQGGYQQEEGGGGDTTPPVVTVEAPNGDETWEVNTAHYITWEATDDTGVDHVNIYYTTNEGSAWTAITTESTAPSPYSWTTPNIASNKYKISLEAVDAAANISTDESDSNFTIYKIGSSSGCVLWNKLGSTTEVENSEIGPNGTVSGAVYYESGIFGDGVRAVSDSNGAVDFGDLGISNRGCYDFWVKPLYANGAVGDEYDAVFSSWSVDYDRVIVWLHYGSPGYIWAIVQTNDGGRYDYNYSMTWNAGDKIHIGLPWDSTASFDGSKTSALYVNGVQVDSSTTPITNMPDLGQTSALCFWQSGVHYGGLFSDKTIVDNVKVFNYPKTDFSDRFYDGVAPDTTAPVVTVETPNGGDYWGVNSAHNITWEATDDSGVDHINIYYTTDEGSSWTTITTESTAPSLYSWTTPNIASDKYKIRIQAVDAAGNMATDESNSDFTVYKKGSSTGCILWNRLDSDSSVEASEIGPNGTIVGNISYEAVKFGNGAATSEWNSFVNFGSGDSLLDKTEGCIEFWMKPQFGMSGGNNSNGEWDMMVDNRPGGYQHMEIMAWPPSYGNGMSFMYNYPNNQNVYLGSILSWNSGDIMHIACVWSSAGDIPGSHTLAIYINGSLEGYYDGALTTSFSLDDFSVCGSGSGTYPGYTYIDNIKVWNYAKTDFSDRFYEGFETVAPPSPGNVTNQRTGTSYATIETALSAASAGDTLLCVGTFEEHDIVWPNLPGITLKASIESSPVTIDAKAAGRVINVVNGQSLTIEGITLQNGYIAGNGGGIYLAAASDLILKNSTILLCTAESSVGGAVYSAGATVHAQNTKFIGNSAGTGGNGGVAGYGNWSVNSCVFEHNVAHYGAITYGWAGYRSGTFTATNCVFAYNEGAGVDGIAMSNGNDRWTDFNCTFYGNIDGSSFGMVDYVNSYISKNSIIWNTSGVVFSGARNSYNEIRYTDIQPDAWIDDTGNISAEPLFVSTNETNSLFLYLDAGSPCIDTGTSTGAPSTDLAGNPRPVNAGYDMGAYENQTVVVSSTEIWVSTTGSDDAGDGTIGNPYLTIQKGLNSVAPGGTVKVFGGTYNEYNINWPNINNITLKASAETYPVTIDAGGVSGQRCILVANTVNMTLESITLQGGKVTGPGGGIYISAANTILGLKNVLIQNCTIEGIYNYGAAVSCTDNTVVVNVNNSIFQRNSVWHAGGCGGYGTWNVTNSIFRNNYSQNSAPVSENGVWNVTNCTIEGNYSETGGGVSMMGTWNAMNCVFKNNSGSNAGVAHTVTFTATNCVFSSNEARTEPGGVFYNGDWDMTNCTFFKNRSSGNGGIAHTDGGSTFRARNTIFWYNSAPLFDGGPTIDITYSDIQDNDFQSGTGNISLEPSFVSTVEPYDLNLGSGSPCIDVGTSTGAPSTDLAGLLRPRGSGYDMGAYEFPSAPVLWVSTTGSDTTGDGSMGNPFATIQRGLNSSEAGSTVKVFGGIYNETITWPNTNNLTLMASIDSSPVTIDSQAAGRVIDVPNTVNMTIEGIMLQGGKISDHGGGIYFESANSKLWFTNSTISYCTVEGGNHFGAAIGCVDNTVMIYADNSHFDMNQVFHAGGAFFQGTLIANNCTINNNYAGWVGGALYAGVYNLINCEMNNNYSGAGGGASISTTLYALNTNFFHNSGSDAGMGEGITCTATNCVFYDNTARGAPGGVTYGGIFDVYNCIFYENHADTSYGGVGYNSTWNAVNSIFWGNTAAYDPVMSGSTTSLRYCDIQTDGYIAGTGNLSVDAMFASTNENDPDFLDLAQGSPLIGAGTNEGVWPYDKYGNPLGAYSGMGTAQFQGPYVKVISPNGGESYTSFDNVTITWFATDEVSGIKSNTINIRYSSNEGSSWTPITSGHSNTGIYTWEAPIAGSNQYLVSIEAENNSNVWNSDVSDSTFEVVPISDSTPPVVTLEAPNGGEIWETNAAKTIKWTATDNILVDHVNFYYTTNEGASWTTIVTGEANDGSYSWLVPTVASTEYRVSVEAVDWTNNSSSDISDSVFEVQYVPIVYVSPTGSDDAGDGSIPNPYRTVQKGLDVSSSGGQVRMMTGTYTVESGQYSNYSMINWPNVQNITLTSSDEYAVCTIDATGGPASRRLIRVANAVALNISNCTIQNGYVRANESQYGGAVWLASGATLNISNVSFRSNQAYAANSTYTYGMGGAIYSFDDTAIINADKCRFISNYGKNRGGVGYNGTWNVTNSIFYNNSSNTGSFGSGGGVASNGTWTVTNCAFFANNARNGYGEIAVYGSWSMTNSFVYRSGPSRVQFSTVSPCNIRYSNVKPLTDSGVTYSNCINAYPIFVSGTEGAGFLELATGSPCIDTGTFESGIPTKDAFGRSRPHNTYADMGVYEFQGPYVKLLTPASGESYDLGENITITWVATDDYGLKGSTPITLTYSRDFGVTWNILAQNIANTGIFTWEALQLLSVDLMISVEATNSLSISNIKTSSYPFFILSDIIYVSPTGSDETGTGTIDAPLQTVQKALNCVYPTGEVDLMDGIYYQFADWPAKNDITLKASNETTAATMDGSVLSFMMINIDYPIRATIEGITFQNGLGGYYIGPHASAVNISDYGAGAVLRLVNDQFLNNNGNYWDGAALMFYGGYSGDLTTVEAVNCQFLGNYNNYWNGNGAAVYGYYFTDFSAYNCIFKDNNVPDGSAPVFYESEGGLELQWKIFNCTFLNNYSGNNQYNIVYVWGDFRNCIFWGSDYEIDAYGTLVNCDVQGGTQTNSSWANCISVLPVFLSTQEGNANYMKLGPGSNMIDKGAIGTWETGIPTLDAAGKKRPHNWIPDLGAYEFQGPSVTLFTPVGGEQYNPQDPIKITMTWFATDEYGLRPSPLPITLRVTTDEGLSWDNLASNIANTGIFTWEPTSPILSNHYYISIEAISDTTEANWNYARNSGVFTIRPTKVYVSIGGDDGNSGSITSPVRTIQHALNMVDISGEVFVDSGVYDEYDIIWPDRNDITLKPSNESSVCTIDAGTTSRCLSITTNVNVSIEGFTLRDGSVSDAGGGAIMCNNSSYDASSTSLPKVTIRNCKILNNYINDPYGWGGAVYIRGYDSSIYNCIFQDNTSESTSGDGPGGLMIQSGFYSPSNYAGPATANVTNCLFFHNIGGWAGGASTYYNNQVTVESCTFVSNEALSGAAYGAGLYTGTTFGGVMTTVNNSIFWGNTAAIGVPQIYDEPNGGSTQITYSCIEYGSSGGIGGSAFFGPGTTESNPEFLSWNAGPNFLRLGVGSPCIDTATGEGAPTEDLDHVARPRGFWYDMGAYEFRGPSVRLLVPDGGENYDPLSALKITIRWFDQDPDGFRTSPPPVNLRYSTNEGVSWSLITQETLNTGIYTWEPSVLDLSAFYYVSVEVVNINSLWNVDRSNGVFSVLPSYVYVSPSGSDETGTGAINSPYRTMQKGLQSVASSGEVRAMSGIYTIEAGELVNGSIINWPKKPDITIKSSNETSVCTIDAQGNGRILLLTNEVTATIDNIDLINGSTNEYGGCGYLGANTNLRLKNLTVDNCQSVSSGGGAFLTFNSTTYINADNCLFSNNHGTGGVAYAYWAGNFYANNSKFKNNYSPNEGAVFRVMSVIATNCSFSDNHAEGYGGVTYQCGMLANNCVFNNNLALSGGGVDWQSWFTTRNCTFYNNTSEAGSVTGFSQWVSSNSIYWANPSPDQVFYGATTTMNYSDIQDWTSGGDGNISGEPNFVSTFEGPTFFRLAGGSPCIDTGSFEGVVSPDLAGKPRIHGFTVDMGAYEFQGPSVRLVTPNGGEFYKSGNSVNITWVITDETYSISPDSISISYTRDDGASWVWIASHEANDGVFSWTAPAIVSDHYLISIEAKNGSGEANRDNSDTYFKVLTEHVYISPSGSDEAGNGSITAPYRTIQKGLNFVLPTGEVFMMSGVYTIEASEFNTSAMVNWPNVQDITLKVSPDATEPVTVDARSSGRIFNIINPIRATIEGITLQNGRITGSGGGINLGNGVILGLRNLTITSCTAEGGQNGGAVFLQGGYFSSVEAENCTFESNYADNAGGFSTGPIQWTVRNCLFQNNVTAWYGGLDYAGIWKITGSRFINNSSINYVGGVFCYSYVDASKSKFIGNTSQYGGVAGWCGYFNASDSLFIGNSAGQDGGVMRESNTSTVTNCAFAYNHSYYGGIVYNMTMNGYNCTFYGNTSDAVAISYYTPMTFTNSIFWGNYDPYNTVFASYDPTLTYCDVQVYAPWPAGTGNISAEPMFASTAEGDSNMLYLAKNSPCIDSGTFEGAPASDEADHPRPHGLGFDMGFNEFWGPSVMVIYPNGGQTFYSGNNIEIRWSASDESGMRNSPKPITIRYSSNEGSSWSIVTQEVANTGIYTWEAPIENTSQALISIEAVNLMNIANYDTSDSTFEIVADNVPPVITLEAPNGGETWETGSVHNISWEATDNASGVDYLNIYYTTNEGITWIALATREANDGMWPWFIPSVSTTEARVRITAVDKARNTATDESDADFRLSLKLIVYVSTTGSDEDGDGTTEHPYQTIQKALDKVGDGGTVFVEAGIYTAATSEFVNSSMINWPNKQNITLTAVPGATGLVTIDAQNRGRAMFIGTAENLTIEGITLQNGYVDQTSNFNSGGLMALASGSVLDFIDSSLRFGSAMGGLATGGGIYAPGSTLYFHDSYFDNNGAQAYGGVANSGSGTVEAVNCVFYRNAAWGGSIGYYGDWTVTNCTFYDNGFGVPYGNIAAYGTWKIKNCIIWTTNDNVSQFFFVTGEVSYTDGKDLTRQGLHDYPGSFGPVILSGVISREPIFISTIESDPGFLKLGPGSPCIDAASLEAPTPDHAGKPRPRNWVPDMGAYEFEGPSIWLYTPNGGQHFHTSEAITITWRATDEYGLRASPPPINIRYSTNGGISYTLITNMANTGIYTWEAPNIVSQLYLISIEVVNTSTETNGDYYNYNYDVSDTVFSVFFLYPSSSLTSEALPISSPNRVRLYWTASTSEVLDGYNIYRGLTQETYEPTPLNGSTPTTETKYDDTTVVLGHDYYYAIKAVAHSIEGPYSKWTSAPQLKMTRYATVEAPIAQGYTGNEHDPVPGASIIYSIRYENIGFAPAASIIINDKIPTHTDYKVGSATGEAVILITFSNDGGSNYGYSPTGTYIDANVTNISWETQNVSSGIIKLCTYEVVIR